MEIGSNGDTSLGCCGALKEGRQDKAGFVNGTAPELKSSPIVETHSEPMK